MKILVIGCGYFGFQAAQLWKNEGHHVFVTTRSKHRADELAGFGFVSVVLDITQPDTLSSLPLVDVVLFSVGFDRNSNDDIRCVYVDGLANVLENLPDSVEQFIYTSSTGVLASSDGEWIDESAPTGPSRLGGKAHLEAEQILRDGEWSDRTTILRLAGIYGPNRIPRLQAVRNRDWHLLPQQGHVNLIHVDDAAGIANRVVELRLTQKLYHVSDGQAPLRRDVYEFVAAELGAGEIDWDQKVDAMVAIRSAGNKRISNGMISEETKYLFHYPEFKSGIRAALEKTNFDGLE